jgi:hypothetical protein
VSLARSEFTQAVDGLQRGVDGFAAEPAQEYLLWRLIALVGVALAKAMRGDADGAAAAHESIVALCRPRGES